MSWSVSAFGKTTAVAAKLSADFARITCSEPEQSIKNKVAEVVAAALAVYPAGTVVRVEASGSQYTPDSTKPDEKTNNVKLSLDPVHGFVEDAPPPVSVV